MFTSPHLILFFCCLPSYYFHPLPTLASVPLDLSFLLFSPSSSSSPVPVLFYIFFLSSFNSSFSTFLILYSSSFCSSSSLLIPPPSSSSSSFFLLPLTPFDFSLLLLSPSSDGYLRLLFSSFVYPSSFSSLFLLQTSSLQSKRNVQSLARVSVASILLGFFGLKTWFPRMSLWWGWYYLHKMFEKVVLRVNFSADRLTDHALPPTLCSHLV